MMSLSWEIIWQPLQNVQERSRVLRFTYLFGGFFDAHPIKGSVSFLSVIAFSVFELIQKTEGIGHAKTLAEHFVRFDGDFF